MGPLGRSVRRAVGHGGHHSHPNAAAQVWKNGPLYLPMPQGCRLSHKKDPLGEDSVPVLVSCRTYAANFHLRNEKAPLQLWLQRG